MEAGDIQNKQFTVFQETNKKGKVIELASFFSFYFVYLFLKILCVGRGEQTRTIIDPNLGIQAGMSVS